jgi:uncharacterized protein
MSTGTGAQGVEFTRVRFEDRFWVPLMGASARTTIPLCLDRCEETGRISNFAKAARRQEGAFEGIYYNDSDVYKVLEGVAYTLHHRRDPGLEARADAVIDSIAAAQWTDGYLNTYYSLKDPAARWTDMGMHEDYCQGHLLEAAVAYFHATGKRSLLDVAIRVADHLAGTFGPGHRHWVAGHEEIELALARLFDATGDRKYLDLSHWFLEERGRGHGAGFIWKRDDWGALYCQDDAPVTEMRHIAGHAVRAMYLYSAMADIAARMGERRYLTALERLWESTVDGNMYVTGGIGSSASNEGFTRDYDLPNATSYCETCASVGMVLWNHRMFLLTGLSRYADVLERCMYNGAIAGVSLRGNTFFYDNPLESDGTKHRKPWFDCSCCPTQIARFIPSVGNYMYASSADTLWINLYAESTASLRIGGFETTVVQRTDYPWDGKIRVELRPGSEQAFTVAMRLPDWCGSFAARLNGGGLPALRSADGYLRITRRWKGGDGIELDLGADPARVHADPRVEADWGKVCIQRGPLVYCFEECDNPGFDALHISPEAELVPGTAEGLPPGTGSVAVRNPDGSRFTAVPYYAWDNRAPGKMKVWVAER